ncbi:cytoplasm protein [Aspergillus luchuensis]|uniref:Cytoplasm protein n=1 Tax=Aspergillus kawachii TaxID=1069201 RepID=A0A146FYG9_ASPKA|nr:cytoplasm protein [Aspergillus luchuensis]
MTEQKDQGGGGQTGMIAAPPAQQQIMGERWRLGQKQQTQAPPG